MILDDRFPEDTLFLVFEYDYRFWPIGEDPDGADDYSTRLETMLAKRKRSVSPKKINMKADTASRKSGQASSSSSGAYRPEAKGKEKGKAIVTQHHYTPVRGSTIPEHPNEGLSTNVADLLRIATFCSRQSMGEIIWFGWCAPAKTKPTWLWKGSHGIMLTKRGAAHIMLAIADGRVQRGHIDLVLLQWLRSEEEAIKAGASYTWPMIGSYYGHASGCDPATFGEAQGGRPSGWEDGGGKPAKGTRVKEDQHERRKFIVQWRGTGVNKTERHWIPMPQDEELHTDTFKWRSFRGEPTATPKHQAERGGFTSHLPRGVLPPKATKEEDSDDETTMTERAKRIKREWSARENKRTFVDNPDEAVPPIALFYFFQSESHHQIPVHFIAYPCTAQFYNFVKIS